MAGKHVETKAELAERWEKRISAAERVYSAWAQRFKVGVLYQYYEGFQHLIEQDQNNLPYVVNLVYSTIEQKLPNMLFDHPEFILRPRPYGDSANTDSMNKTQLKEDALNFICGREEYGLNDKHELAVLDSFFGFGVLETDYSKDKVSNPAYVGKRPNTLDSIYCKQIPFDRFRVSALANWDLSKGRWFGYFEFLTYKELEKYVDEGLIIEPKNGVDAVEDDFAQLPFSNGKIVVTDSVDQVAPSGTVKVWKIWDFDSMKQLRICNDAAERGDRILEELDFTDSPISTLRLGKRRRGWYPLPPVFQWLSPQDEINDIAQAARIHRKRFSRKYVAIEGTIDEEEMNKFLYGPDGTVVWVNKMENFKAVDDAPLDNANPQALIRSYEDMNRVSGTSDEMRAVADRQTATQSSIINSRAQIRESKDLVRVAGFLTSFARNVMRAIGKAPGSFWVKTKLPEDLLGELRNENTKWTQVPGSLFKEEDYEVDIAVASISPVYQQKDKQTFMEFLAIITQYEILSMSPALLREAAYRIGYKNSSVLNQFQQLAQLAALGRLQQAKLQIQPVGQGGQQPTSPGQLPQQQMAVSTPPTNEGIANLVFNRQGVQQPQ